MDNIFTILLIQIMMALLALVFWTIYRHNRKEYLPNMVMIPVYIDKKFTLLEKDDIGKALRNWEKASKGLLSFCVMTDRAKFDYNKLEELSDRDTIGPIWFTKWRSSSDYIQELDGCYGKEALGYADIRFNYKLVAIVADRIDTRILFENVATHEIGHILWLPHSKNRRSVMYKNSCRTPQKITPDDVRRIYSYLGWFTCTVSTKEQHHQQQDKP